MDKLTPEQIKDWEEKIENMSHIEMARLQRFAPIGHPLFRVDLLLSHKFIKKFNDFGRMTTSISKQIGLDSKNNLIRETLAKNKVF